MAKESDRELAGRHLWQITATRDLLVVLGVALLLCLVYSLREVFMPLLVALVLAHVFNPVVTRLEKKWRWPRPATAGLLVIIFLLGFAGFLSWLGPLLLSQLVDLLARLPEYFRTLAAAYNIDPGSVLNQIEQSLSQIQFDLRQILSHVFKTSGQAFGFFTTVFSAAVYFMLSFALVLIYFFFFSWHFNTALQKFARYLPESRKHRIVEILSQMDQAIGQFFRGRLVIAFIMGVLLSAGWFLAGVPYWFFLGMVTGLLNVVPYLSIVTWPIAVLLKYVETLTAGGENPGVLSVLVWPSTVYIGVQLLESWVLTPWIQSGQTNLSAATIIIVVFIGGSLAGVWGMLFAIPVAACIKVLLNDLILPRLRRWAGEH